MQNKFRNTVESGREDAGKECPHMGADKDNASIKKKIVTLLMEEKCTVADAKRILMASIYAIEESSTVQSEM